MRGAKDYDGIPSELRKEQYTPSTWALANKTPEDVGVKKGSMISERELDAYVKAYSRGGFNGGLNWLVSGTRTSDGQANASNVD
jgi:hypothetical protein